MSVVAIASAKGSPGATMTALALGAAWPRPVVVADVDPVGGDLAWRCRAPGGDPLDPDRGLLTLAAAARRGADDVQLEEHLQDTSLGFPALVGVPSPEQMAGLGAVWSQLPQLFDAHDADVLVDLGRVVPGSSPLPVMLKADLVLFAVRPDLEGVAQLRTRLRGFADALRIDRPGLGGPGVGVVVRTTYRDTAVVADLQRLIDSEGLSVQVLGILAEDPKGARTLCAGRLGDPRKTLVGRSARSLVEKVDALLVAASTLEVV